MARGQSSDGSNTTEATAETDTAAAAGGNDSRFKMLDVPAGHASGLSGQQKRVDVIRALARTGQYTRGEIKKQINDLGDPIAYQIVFQATRGIEGIPEAKSRKAAEAPATEGGQTAPAEAGSGEPVAAE